MQIGTTKEIKTHEYRVGLTPACVRAYCGHGHQVIVEAGVGSNAGFPDAEYAAADATVVPDKRHIFAAADMLIKVKEPLPEEYDFFREGQILYAYLHLAPSPEQARRSADV